MKTVYKGIVFALTAAILLSLCFTPTVFATEELPAATPSDAEKEELLPATPSNAEKAELLTATSSNAVEDTVSTGEELMEWLSGHKDTGGAVKLTADISLGDFYYARNRGAAAITVDTGVFSIRVNGYVYLQATSPFLIRGVGGEQGVLRTSGAGSMLHLNVLALEAEKGYAVFQEEGTGFILENTSVSGDVHYADQPFVWEWEPGLAVAARGENLEAGMLPATLSVCVNRQGQNTYPYEKVPVTWDLSGHEEDRKLRRRFTVSGVFEDMASQNAPVCTVVYDDFPLTFLQVNVRKTKGTYGDAYRFTGGFSKPEDRLPITVAQEYSFDGENWTLYEENTITTLNSGFIIIPFVKAEDRERFTEIFIRLRWDDDGTVYYSNVLRFAADSLLANEEPGGNRGGGTDIVDPPKLPQPDPEPETTPPPVTSEPEITPPETSEPETAPPPVTSAPTPGRPGNRGADHESDGEGAESPPPISVPKHAPGPGQVLEPALPNEAVASSTVEGEETKTPSAAADTVLSRAPSVSDSADVPPSVESTEVLPEPEAESPVPGPDMLPIAAGLAAIAVSIGGAALYLHPKVWKRLMGRVWKLFKR